MAELSEIKENDYNLNIPRYVDTFDQEEPVDLTAVAANLTALEKEIAETEKAIAHACSDLELPTPF